MGTMFAFGVGVVVGAVLSFKAGGDFRDLRRASIEAALHVGHARTRARLATSSVVTFALVVGFGIALMAFA